MDPRAWHIVTGEYARAPGGVADYTRHLACALAEAGDEVHVWTPGTPQGLADDPGVRVHPLIRGYGPSGLLALSREMRRETTPRRLLVQYVPQAFGMGGMNLAFCAWLAALRDAEVWVMFHEVALPWAQWPRWRPNVASAITRAMAAIVASRADHIFVSVPFWDRVLHDIVPNCGGTTWLPIPSNVPSHTSAEAIQVVRSRLPIGEGGRVIGHFGTYGSLLAPHLKQVLVALLATDRRRIALLIGRGGDHFGRELAVDPALAGRIVATGDLSATDIAAYLGASDVLVQPYPDGVSSRRTSVMAGLALGVPIATNEGIVTEPIWRTSGGVELASSMSGIARAAETVLGDSKRAAGVAASGRALYERAFTLSRTVQTLRGTSVAGGVS